ncbi:MAG: TadE family protein [Coprobacillaceae bacterium]
MKKKFFLIEEGQSLVEFALVFPLVFALMMFVFDFGWIAYQITVFQQGYLYSSWNVSAQELGDTNLIEEVPSINVYDDTDNIVSDALRDSLEESSYFGFETANFTIKNATATLYNEEEIFKVPGRISGEVVDATNRTRYIELEADLSYDVYPATWFGEVLFGDKIISEKHVNTKRIVGSTHRSQ